MLYVSNGKVAGEYICVVYNALIPCISLSLPRPVPIIASVEVAVLSLFEVEVNISLLTNGGQSVTQYTVSWCTCVCSKCLCFDRGVHAGEEFHGLKGRHGAFRKWTS